MVNRNFRVVFGLVASVALTFGANVQAGWGSYGSSGGSSGGSWGSSGGSWGSSGGSWGSHGSSGGGWFSHWSRPGLLHRVFHHHHYRGHSSYGSSGGSSGGSWGSSGGSSGGVVYSSGYGSSGGHGSSGGYGSSGATYYSPVVPQTTIPSAPAAPAAPGTLPEANRATLKVAVPEDALVYVNGILTKSTGNERTYISRGLNSGFQYTYEVRAEAIRDGKKVEETKVVSLKAGESMDVAFNSLTPAPVATVAKETSLTVQVPSDAKVTLGGNPTVGTGSVRTFTTSKLSGENAWRDYVVQVSVERDGRTLTQEKTITLGAGDSQTLTFDFANEQVASR